MKEPFLGDVPFLSALPEPEQKRLAERMHLQSYRGGEVLFQRGDQSTALYLVKSGWLRLLADGSIVIASLGPGSLIGEIDFLLDRPRTTGASLANDSELWVLTREELLDLIAQDPQLGVDLSLAFGARLGLLDRHLIEHRLRALPALAGLTDDALAAIAGRLVPVNRKRGETIVERGQAPQALFIVESGQVELFETDDAGTLREIGAGEMFGEMAVMAGSPHIQSARATSDAVLWALPAAEFELLTAERPDIRRALSRNVRAPLSSMERGHASERLSTIPLFAGLTPEALQAVVERMVVRHVPAGEVVFAEGTAGDALYLVEKGQIEIAASAEPGSLVLERLGAGDLFGEAALLTGRPSPTAARAATHSNLWQLARSDFEDLAHHYPSVGLALSRVLSERLAEMDRCSSESQMRRMKLLAGLSPSQLADISRRVTLVRVRQGETVIQEGGPGDRMYFIEAGHVQVVRGAGHDALPLAELGPGDVVGEMALLTGAPRSATVIALSDLELWALAKSDFDEVVSAQPGFALALSRLLSERLRSTDEHILRGSAAPVVSEMPARAMVTTAPRQRRAVPPQPVPPTRRARRQAGKGILAVVREAFGQASDWFGSLSRGAKVRLVLVTLLLIWLTFITVPALLISALAEQGVTDMRGAIAFIQREDVVASSSVPPQDARMGADEIAAPQALTRSETDAFAASLAAEPVAPEVESLGLGSAPAEEGMVGAMLAEQPTEPPTATPWIIVVTNTPEPTPLPTETPLPTQTPVPPTATPKAAAAKVVPTATPTPRAQLPRDLDPRLALLKVGIEEPAGLKPGETYWRLVRAYWQDGEQAALDHTIYIEVLDENGRRIVGQPVLIQWGGGESLTVYVEDKPPPAYGANFAMWNALGSYHVSIPGQPSDRITGLGMGSIEEPTRMVHTNFLLTFQRTTW